MGKARALAYAPSPRGALEAKRRRFTAVSGLQRMSGALANAASVSTRLVERRRTARAMPASPDACHLFRGLSLIVHVATRTMPCAAPARAVKVLRHPVVLLVRERGHVLQACLSHCPLPSSCPNI